MARMAAAERREQIAAVARGLFAEHGYRAVAVDEIARRAGVARATAEVGGGKARLRAAIDAFFALAEAQPLIAGEPVGDAELRATAERRGAQADAALAEVLGSGGRLFHREPERERSLALTARMVRHALLGMSGWWREHPETPRSVLVDHAMDVMWTGLRALRKSGRR